MAWLFSFAFYLISLLIGPLLASVVSARYYSLTELEQSFHQEVAAHHRMSWRDNQVEGRTQRAHLVTRHVSYALDTSNWQAGSGDIAEAASGGLSNLGRKVLSIIFGDNGQAKWAAFLPTMTMRLEVFYLCYLLMLPLLIVSYLLGAHWGRRAMRQGVHKRESKMRWILKGVGFLLLLEIALVGIPGMWPVVFWIGPALALVAGGYVLVRASMIQPS